MSVCYLNFSGFFFRVMVILTVLFNKIHLLEPALGPKSFQITLHEILDVNVPNFVAGDTVVGKKSNSIMCIVFMGQ